MTAPKRSRIIIESESEREKQDLALLLAMFFKSRNIAVHGITDFGQATLHGMSGMFAHDVMMGNTDITIEQAPPNPDISAMPTLRVEVSGPPHSGGVNLALYLKTQLEQLPWNVALEGQDLQMSSGEISISDVDKNVTSLASHTDTKVVISQRNIPYRIG